MESTTITLRATYDPNLDTLYLRTPSCTGSYLDSEDGIFFFTILNHRESKTPCGFEIHFFSEVWNDEEIIPGFDMRFDIIDAEIHDASLDEVLQWAFETYVKPRQQARQMQYGKQRAVRLQAVHEGPAKPDYDT